MSSSFFKKNKGFTIIEILLVMGVLTVLFTIVIIAFDPGKQIGRANNAKRKSDIVSILNAVGAYYSDNKGVYPSGISTSVASVSSSGADICTSIVPKYIGALPIDPSLSEGEVTTCTNYNTGYAIVKDANNRITISAPLSQFGENVSVSR
jgi:prepilin-type N-terminal cleavage/methylation domain-containing protein